MISKILKPSRNFKAVIEYATQKNKHHKVIMCHGVRDYFATKTVQDFMRQAKLNPKIRSCVLHVALSHHPDDVRKIKGREKEILEKYLDKLKARGVDFYDTQFIVYKHNDRAHVHYHLIANYVNNQFKRFNDSHIGVKAKLCSKELTKELNLTQAINPALRKRDNRDLQQEQQTNTTNRKNGIRY